MKSEILNRELNCRISHVGLFVEKESLWLHDLWSVSFGGAVPTSYKTGVGHREKRKVFMQHQKEEQRRFLNGNFKKEYEYLLWVAKGYEDWTEAKTPCLDSVLHSLVMDASFADGTFYDFCDDCGYDRDSISALKTYEACLESKETLDALLDTVKLNMEQIQEAFQDY